MPILKYPIFKKNLFYFYLFVMFALFGCNKNHVQKEVKFPKKSHPYEKPFPHNCSERLINIPLW